jgi:hypothetical protein
MSAMEVDGPRRLIETEEILGGSAPPGAQAAC